MHGTPIDVLARNIGQPVRLSGRREKYPHIPGKLLIVRDNGWCYVKPRGHKHGEWIRCEHVRLWKARATCS